MIKSASRLEKGLIAGGIMILVALTVVLAVILANHQTKDEVLTDASCAQRSHTSRQVVIKDGKVSPAHTDGRLCDTLTIINRDDTQRLLSFGEHEHHQAYDGVTQRLVGRGGQLTITMIKTGSYRFHDHIHDEVQGTFTVLAE